MVGNRRRLPAAVAAVALAVLLAACDGGRSPARPSGAQAQAGTTVSTTAAPDQGEQRLAAKAHRLQVTTHPEGARLRIQHAGGAAQAARTPFKGQVKGGHLTLTLSRAGSNTLIQRVLLDRDRSMDLWLDPKGLLHHQIGTFDTGSNPKQVAFSPDGKEIWVTLLGGHGVQVFDARTRKLRDQIRLGQHGAVEVIFTRDGGTVFASQMESASVFEIDRATHKVRRQPRGLYPTPDGKRLFVAGYADGEIQRIDLASGASKVLIRTGGAMRHLVGDPEAGKLYADDMATSQAFVVDLATERVRQLARTDKMPNTIDLSPDGKVLYVSNRGRNGRCYCAPGPEWGSVLAIDTASGKVLDAIVGGNQSTGLDVSPDGRILAFSDFLDNRVHLYTIPDYQTLAAGGGGRAVAHLKDLAKPGT